MQFIQAIIQHDGLEQEIENNSTSTGTGSPSKGSEQKLNTSAPTPTPAFTDTTDTKSATPATSTSAPATPEPTPSSTEPTTPVVDNTSNSDKVNLKADQPHPDSSHSNTVAKSSATTTSNPSLLDTMTTDNNDKNVPIEEEAETNGTVPESPTAKSESEPEAGLEPESESLEQPTESTTEPEAAETETETKSETTTPTSKEMTAEEAAEAKAVAEATASADAAYVPSPAIMNNTDPQPLLQSVDGPSLKTYQTSPAIYSAKELPLLKGAKVNVPIHVTTGGSVVEYTVESQDYDIGFGIVAERDESVTVVMEHNRIESHMEGITGKFLVGTVPCALIFSFDNEYSWFRDKKITYRITVSPPSIDNILAGRRRRANIALSKVVDDKNKAEERLSKTSKERLSLSTKVERMEKELVEMKKSLGVLTKEEDWLKVRVGLRGVQESSLTKRLEFGWDDEKKEGGDAEEEANGIEV